MTPQSQSFPQVIPLAGHTYDVRETLRERLPDGFRERWLTHRVCLSDHNWNGSCTCPTFQGCCLPVMQLQEWRPGPLTQCDHIIAAQLFALRAMRGVREEVRVGI